MQIVTGVFIRLNPEFFKYNAYYKDIFPFLIKNIHLLFDKPIFEQFTLVIIGKIINAWIDDDYCVMIIFLLYENKQVIFQLVKELILKELI
jgi:hypothetical protein